MQQPSVSSGSDDEAPEELALSLGKSQASKRRHQERARRAEHIQQLNSRHKRKRTSEHEPQAGAHEEHEHQPEPDLDTLPDDVIEALMSK